MPSPSTKTYEVLVVGCGLMGSALARALAQRGHHVAAWNRSPEKAEALAVAGVRAIENLDDAVRASRVILACTSTYETTLDALRQVAAWDDVTLVNVGTGTPDEVDAMRQWAADRGAAYLDGAILCYPQHIGTPDGLLLFSGPEEIWQLHEPVLQALGQPVHVSAQTRGASVLDVTFAGGFYIASLVAYVEAAAYALSQGLSAAELAGISETVVDLMRVTVPEIAQCIESGKHDTDQATISVYSAGLVSCRDAMRSAGHEARMLDTAAGFLGSAEAAGAGHLGFSALAAVGDRKGKS
ncbi:NAD(P)-dependent oxidoreductase [Amycolatopsis sp. WGS_07]|uniref:NAD(P)-dependent oxidoreductase n=1 Tax=Amycolatopsis sp. WGS_07 TaxID=3076764 RepID=UPI003873690C